MSREIYRTGIGQDSHRFLSEETTKPCILAGLRFEGVDGLKANSDGDLIYHAICNAISSLTGVLILGEIADELLAKSGITDSEVYLKEGLKLLGKQKIVHVALSLEGSRPHFRKRIGDMRENLAKVLGIDSSQVGITATTGEGLTDYGLGQGLNCFCILTTVEQEI